MAIETHTGEPAARISLGRGLAKLWHGRAPATVHGAVRPTLFERVLHARGLSANSDDFLNPSLNHLHDPSLIPDLDRAAERILSALRAREPIVVYGDYDVDGITASSILWHTLRTLDPDAPVSTYVPHRLDEGYGLSSDALTELTRRGAKLVVSVDCGITAFAPARVARDAGVDLIITDHHNPPGPGEPLPDAFAVVHPRRADSTYPFGELSGAGVAYKLAWRLCTLDAGAAKVDPRRRAHLIEMLALASLGTVADVVPLLGENRVICRFGLARIQHSPIVGLRALVEASGLAGENVNAEDVGFRLGPRLNACGRLGHAAPAVELLTTAGPGRAREIAEDLTRVNTERRTTERRILDQAVELVEAGGMNAPDRRAIVLAHDDWHAGVVGIVCSKLVERYHRPTILLSRTGDECHGSGRSIQGFKLADALRECSPHLLTHGGHDMAAGLKLRASELDAFAAAFIANANSTIAVDQLVGSLTVDTDAVLSELTPESVRTLERLSPFGPGNPPVRIQLQHLTLTESPSAFGRDGSHVSLRVRDARAEHEGQPRRVVRLVGWGWAQRARGLRAGQAIDAVISPTISSWNGTTSVEPQVVDLRVIDA